MPLSLRLGFDGASWAPDAQVAQLASLKRDTHKMISDNNVRRGPLQAPRGSNSRGGACEGWCLAGSRRQARRSLLPAPFPPPLSQPMPPSQVEEAVQPGTLPLAKMELEIVAKVTQASRLGQADFGRGLPGDLLKQGQALVPSGGQGISINARQRAAATHSAEDEQQPGPPRPLAQSQAKASFSRGGHMPRSPITTIASASQSAGAVSNGKGTSRGCRSNRSRSRIWASAALVREPSSKARVCTCSTGTRPYRLTLSTGPSQATTASGDPQPGCRDTRSKAPAARRTARGQPVGRSGWEIDDPISASTTNTVAR